MLFASRKDLPETGHCLKCGKDKPLKQMIVVRHRKDGTFQLRPRCKDCYNARERGHRREYKREYLRRWREYNSELNDSYWKNPTPEKRARTNAIARAHVERNHYAILIQGRLRRRLGMHIDIDEARRLLKKFGPCYPTRYGLTRGGLRECERIRSNMRRTKQHLDSMEIRMMVYDDGYFIKPSKQKIPYQCAAQRLRNWQAKRKNGGNNGNQNVPPGAVGGIEVQLTQGV